MHANLFAGSKVQRFIGFISVYAYMKLDINLSYTKFQIVLVSF